MLFRSKNTETEAGKLCQRYRAKKVLVHYGGKSAEKSGLLNRVCRELEKLQLEYITLGGVLPILALVKSMKVLLFAVNIKLILFWQ